MALNLNIKERLTLSVGVLVAMIVALVALAAVNLQILTATEPDSPTAEYGLTRALIFVAVFGFICILIGLWLLIKLPNSINRPIQELADGINEIANHKYDVELNLKGGTEMEMVSKNFNRMAKRLRDYHNSATSNLMASKRYLETIVNSIDEPIICLDKNMNMLFVNDEALNVLNISREEVIDKSAQELSMRNDLLRRLVCGLLDEANDKKPEESAKKSEPLKIYADNTGFYYIKFYILNDENTIGDTLKLHIVNKESLTILVKQKVYSMTLNETKTIDEIFNITASNDAEIKVHLSNDNIFYYPRTKKFLAKAVGSVDITLSITNLTETFYNTFTLSINPIIETETPPQTEDDESSDDNTQPETPLPPEPDDPTQTEIIEISMINYTNNIQLSYNKSKKYKLQYIVTSNTQDYPTQAIVCNVSNPNIITITSSDSPFITIKTLAKGTTLLTITSPLSSTYSLTLTITIV